ncbi:hypothetical protein FO519_009752 [Halicephalobus sp. NKZ332]|nr:hypothetical protein FO519_009752 [Halicephalobus sp. NKZ332]
MALSKRAEKGLARDFKSDGLNQIYASDPYHPEENPNGYIRFSSAFNLLPTDIMNSKLSDSIFSSFDRKELNVVFHNKSESSTRQAVADFVNLHCAPKLSKAIEKDSIVLVPGVTMASDILSHVIFDEEEVALTFAPYYYRFPNDYGDRGLVEVEPVDVYFPDSGKLELRIDVLEEKLEELKKKGKTVKALLVANPRNPDGGYFGESELKPVIDWAIKRHSLYVIFDEIYNKTVFEPLDDGSEFKSALNIIDEDPEYDRSKVIWMWGLSKIFSIPGLRAAAIFSTNERLLESIKKSMMYNGLNALTQHVVKEILNDREFVTDFFSANRNLLKSARDNCIRLFKELNPNPERPVRILPAKSAFFFLVDFGSFLKERTFEEEEKLQEKFISEKVLLIPGKFLIMPEAGWFRMVYSTSDEGELKEGIRRIFAALKKNI